MVNGLLKNLELKERAQLRNGQLLAHSHVEIMNLWFTTTEDRPGVSSGHRKTQLYGDKEGMPALIVFVIEVSKRTELVSK